MADTGPVQRTVALLFHLSASEEVLTVASVAQALGLPRSTAHRMLQQFLELRLLQRVQGARSYAIGPEMHRLADLMARRDSLPQLAQPAMERLVARSGEGCSLGIYRPRDHTLEFVAYTPSPQPLRYHIPLHQPMSVLWGSSGRSVLAFLPPEALSGAIAAQKRSPTGRPVPRLHELTRELGEVRSKGYSLSARGEKIEGAAGISAPIFASGPRVVGCLTLTIPSFRFEERRQAAMARQLATEARRLSRILGGLA